MSSLYRKFYLVSNAKRFFCKCIFSALVVVLFSHTSSSQVLLSTEEKLADFNYLYDEFEKSYPYFEINRRMNQVDWLSKKEEYAQEIEDTEDDKEFFIALTSILNSLNNDHTDTYPTVIYEYFYDAYKGVLEEDSSYLPYVRELEKTDTIRAKYWTEVNSAIIKERKVSNSFESSEEILENIEVDFVDSLSVALIHIQSFSYDYLEADAEKLKAFFNKAHEYCNLVIDIRK